MELLQLLAPDLPSNTSSIKDLKCMHSNYGRSSPDQMSTWPKGFNQMSTWPTVVSHLATRCLCLGVHLTRRSDQMSTWPEVVSHLATRCLYQEGNLTKCQPDSKSDQMSTWPKASSVGGPSKCRKIIWFLEHTMRFCSCFTEVFSYKDQ